MSLEQCLARVEVEAGVDSEEMAKNTELQLKKLPSHMDLVKHPRWASVLTRLKKLKSLFQSHTGNFKSQLSVKRASLSSKDSL